MKTQISIAALALCITAICNPVPAQTTDIDDRSAEIIDACIEAMGGEMALSDVDSLRCDVTSSMSFRGNQHSPRAVKLFIQGSNSRWEDDAAGRVSILLSDRRYVIFRPGENHEVLLDNKVSVSTFSPWPQQIIGLREFPGMVQYAGELDVGGIKTHLLEFSYLRHGKTKTIRRYFDKQTHLLIRQEFSSFGWDEYAYTDFNGLILPSYICQNLGGGTGSCVTEYTNFDLDTEFPDDIFELPEQIRTKTGAQGDSDQ
ncbi:MAG: hypothetical protein ACR2NP_21645 [Pirellulaceae bacterium]